MKKIFKNKVSILSPLVLAACSALLLQSCVTAPYQPYSREVKKAPGKSGVIALKAGYNDQDRADADKKMKRNCATKSVGVAEEGEVSVGQKTNSTAEKTHGTKNKEAFKIGGLAFGSQKPSEDIETSTTTTDVKEWQISYNCK